MDSKINRRDTIKTLLIGTLGAGALGTSGCKTEPQEALSDISPSPKYYGRTDKEKLRDEMLAAQPEFFSEAELTSLGILIDLILPADEDSGSASEAGVLEFISFIVKDMEYHKLPLRSGLGWINRESMQRFSKNFNDLSSSETISIIDDIAYPDETLPENLQGEKFFSLLRNLTLTGFYTSEMGIKDVGYMGNRPNFWDGVPDEVLKAHGLEYDDKYLPLYISQERNAKVAQWDNDGNLI